MKKRKYTMTPAAHAQRVAASRKRKRLVQEWATIKVARENADYCKAEFGSPNEAINTLREMNGGAI